MAIETVPTLIEALRDSRLLTDEQLLAAERSAADQFPQPRDLANDLVERGWLTRYQAKQILRGHGSQLVLGTYRLLERLGEGGMGHVYKALHLPMNRIVALKVVKPNMLADPVALKRFRREIQAAAKLSHPNIITVFDAAEAGGVHYLAMEYVDGTDFASLVRDGGPMPVAAACDYVRQAALGLGHAHEHGIVHRDVKPSNLLVTRTGPAGVVKVLDLGLARPLSLETDDSQSASALTVDGVVVGTPDFMAPEQAKNSHAVDLRADLYSLGCTFYYILTARLPFPAGNVIDKLIKHQLEDPYPLELIRADVPGALFPVLHRLMAKKPGDRYQSGAEVASALEPFCAEAVAVSAVAVAASNRDASPESDSSTTTLLPVAERPDTATSVTFRFDAAKPTSPPRKKGRTVVCLAIAGVAVLLVVAASVVFAMIAD